MEGVKKWQDERDKGKTEEEKLGWGETAKQEREGG